MQALGYQHLYADRAPNAVINEKDTLPIVYQCTPEPTAISQASGATNDDRPSTGKMAYRSPPKYGFNLFGLLPYVLPPTLNYRSRRIVDRRSTLER